MYLIVYLSPGLVTWMIEPFAFTAFLFCGFSIFSTLKSFCNKCNKRIFVFADEVPCVPCLYVGVIHFNISIQFNWLRQSTVNPSMRILGHHSRLKWPWKHEETLHDAICYGMFRIKIGWSIRIFDDAELVNYPAAIINGSRSLVTKMFPVVGS